MKLTRLLKLGMEGEDVRAVQGKLIEQGYSIHAEGKYDAETRDAVRDFQSHNLDQHGMPLTVDGKVGELTWWSLTHPKPSVQTPSAIDFGVMPPDAAGGTATGRGALGAAIGELAKGAGEVGGNNRGPFVRKYHECTQCAEGEPWCASFASWCFLQAADGDPARLPFRPTPGARDMLKQLQKKNLAHKPGSNFTPEPGDLVFWWRESLSSGRGHVAVVHQLKDGMLYTIEGNRSPKVQGFSYVFSRMDKLLGFARLP